MFAIKDTRSTAQKRTSMLRCLSVETFKLKDASIEIKLIWIMMLLNDACVLLKLLLHDARSSFYSINFQRRNVIKFNCSTCSPVKSEGGPVEIVLTPVKLENGLVKL